MWTDSRSAVNGLARGLRLGPEPASGDAQRLLPLAGLSKAVDLAGLTRSVTSATSRAVEAPAGEGREGLCARDLLNPRSRCVREKRGMTVEVARLARTYPRLPTRQSVSEPRGARRCTSSGSPRDGTSSCAASGRCVLRGKHHCRPRWFHGVGAVS